MVRERILIVQAMLIMLHIDTYSNLLRGHNEPKWVFYYNKILFFPSFINTTHKTIGVTWLESHKTNHDCNLLELADH